MENYLSMNFEVNRNSLKIASRSLKSKENFFLGKLYDVLKRRLNKKGIEFFFYSSKSFSIAEASSNFWKKDSFPIFISRKLEEGLRKTFFTLCEN